MLSILMILAVIARFATNVSNWKIALGLTCVFLLFTHLADNPPSNANLIIALFVSPAAYGICHLFVAILGWIKSKMVRPAFGRQA